MTETNKTQIDQSSSVSIDKQPRITMVRNSISTTGNGKANLIESVFQKTNPRQVKNTNILSRQKRMSSQIDNPSHRSIADELAPRTTDELPQVVSVDTTNTSLANQGSPYPSQAKSVNSLLSRRRPT